MTKLNPQQRHERRTRIWELRLEGWTEARIAAEMGVSQSAISQVLTRFEKRLLARMATTVEAIKARQTVQLERIADQALQAWDRSRMPAELLREVVHSEEVDGKTTTRRNATTEIRGQAGDAALLNQARGALADVRAIWGLDAPQQIETTIEDREVKRMREGMYDEI